MSTQFPYILFLFNPWKLVKLEKRTPTQPTDDDVMSGPEFNPKVIEGCDLHPHNFHLKIKYSTSVKLKSLTNLSMNTAGRKKNQEWKIFFSLYNP